MDSNNLKSENVMEIFDFQTSSETSFPSDPISPASLAAMQILNGLPQLVEKLSQEEYDSFLNNIAKRLSEIFKQGFNQGFEVGYRAGLQYGASFAMEYCTKNIKGMVNMEVLNQGFDRNTVLQALNLSSMDKGN